MKRFLLTAPVLASCGLTSGGAARGAGVDVEGQAVGSDVLLGGVYAARRVAMNQYRNPFTFG